MITELTDLSQLSEMSYTGTLSSYKLSEISNTETRVILYLTYQRHAT